MNIPASHATESLGPVLFTTALPTGGNDNLAIVAEAGKTLRMNTDIRRRIFLTMMAGEDYLDAFEKLMKMKVPGEQEREYVRVLIECCLQENVYNPFYTALGNKLCEFSHSHRITFQYSLWDKLKVVEDLNVKQSSNLARLISYLMAQGGLSLIILKVRKCIYCATYLSKRHESIFLLLRPICI